MFPRIFAARSWFVGYLVSGLLFCCLSVAAAEETPPPIPPEPPTAVVGRPAVSTAPASSDASDQVATNDSVVPQAGIAGPAPPADSAPRTGCDDCGCRPWSWAQVPPVEATPRAGDFTIPPNGPGYYSACDWLEGECRAKPPIYPYRLLSYDNDFRYLENPDNQQCDFFDPLKRIHLGDDWMLSLGGDERVRYMNEENGYLRITDKDNDYTLFRSRVYADLWYQDRVRVFAQFFDAEITGEDLPPQKIDVDKSDFLDLFVDAALLDVDCTPIYVRVGRQELLYGSQRLISNLDWANTERTFQGVKGFWHSSDWDLDAFWTQPVLVNPTHFDSPDDKQDFSGLWATYKPRKGTTWDTYYLYLDNSHPVATGIGGFVGGINVNTVGSRFAGDCNDYLWDIEGMYQFGENANQNISAGAFTTGLGYRLADCAAKPQVWLYYDFASGSQHPHVGDDNTFNQLFPFGHYYFGALDLVGRQNISDLNGQFVFYAVPWVTTSVQYHMFDLVSSRDAIYNAGGTAIAQDTTGKSGHDVGNEVDISDKFQLDMHQDLIVGYSELACGTFLRDTKHVDTIALLYSQYTYRW